MLVERTETSSSLAGSAFRDHSRELHRFLARRVTRVEDADDLAQEVFARLLRVRNVELIRNPLSYLLGIAAHVIREFRQRKQHDRILYDSDLAAELCDNGDDARQGVDFPEQLELRQRLDKALDQLPEAHQLVLLLVKRDGLSYAEAAAAAGLSIHTIEKYVVEARARLRIILAETP
ncbi:MAG: RNA polymerase sigma factor [Steroidobacteraceae bacterium]|jgi:RNA polymerase sigma-70 factor (ECF subfamily)